MASICGNLAISMALQITILSGGQTGVDRAALDAAIEKGLDFRGWCPRGGWAEDLPEPPGLLARYKHLRETPQADPTERTRWNVRDCDRLLVLTDSSGITVSKGTELARNVAFKRERPCLMLDLDAGDALKQARAFIEGEGNIAICIAGPRESEAPGIYAKARAFLRQLL
jgi:Circularly permutated YpsA SLOG family